MAQLRRCGIVRRGVEAVRTHVEDLVGGGESDSCISLEEYEISYDGPSGEIPVTYLTSCNAGGNSL